MAVYSNELNNASVIALGEGPCTGPASASATPTTSRTARRERVNAKFTQTLSSKRFRPRTTIRTPSGWTVTIDNGHAFVLRSAGGTQASDQIGFFLEAYASAGDGRHPDGGPLTGVSRTPSGLVAWLRANPELIATRPSTTRFGRPVLTARSIDIDLSAKARKEDPHCPAPASRISRSAVTAMPSPTARLKANPPVSTSRWIRIGSQVHALRNHGRLAVESYVQAGAACRDRDGEEPQDRRGPGR